MAALVETTGVHSQCPLYHNQEFLPDPAYPVAFTSPVGDQNQFTVAASQTIYAGDIVSISSSAVSQSIALPSTNNTMSLSGGNLPILGIALNPVTTDANGNWTEPGGYVVSSLQLSVAILNDSNGMLAQVAPIVSGSTSQPWTSTNSSISNWNQEVAYQLARFRGSSSSVWWYGISATTTNGEFKFVEAYNVNAIATTANFGWGKFKSILSGTVRQG